MPEEAVKELAQGVRSFLDRLSGFFHIFDLSFLVAGSITVGGIAYLYIKANGVPSITLPSWTVVMALLLACYASGLVSFTIGRFINGYTFRRRVFPHYFKTTLMGHDVSDPKIMDYISEPSWKRNASEKNESKNSDSVDRLWWLYIRMWQDIALYRPDTEPYKHLSRYWVMAATYDGLSAAFTTWAIVILLAMFGDIVLTPISISWGIPLSIGFLLLSMISLKQGADYYKYQIEDIVAAYLAAKGPLAESNHG